MLRTLLAAALVVALPGASAMTLDIRSPSAPLQPEAQQGPIEISAAIPCQDIWARRTQVGASQTLELEVNAPPYVVLSGPTTVAIAPESCPSPQGSTTVETRLLAALTREAPGLVPIQLRIEARLSGQSMLGGDNGRAEGAAVVVAAPWLLLDIRPASKVACACPEALFAVDVQNLGNVQTRVHFQLKEETSGADIMMPDDVIVESPNGGTGPTNGTVFISARLIDGKAAAFTVVVTPMVAFLPSEQGLSREASFLAKGPDLEPLSDEIAEQAPLPAAPLLGLLLLGIAFLARRRA